MVNASRSSGYSSQLKGYTAFSTGTDKISSSTDKSKHFSSRKINVNRLLGPFKFGRLGKVNPEKNIIKKIDRELNKYAKSGCLNAEILGLLVTKFYGQGDAEAIHAILKHGSDHQKGEVLLELIEENGLTDPMKTLLLDQKELFQHNQTNNSLLYDMARSGNCELAEFLMENGFSLNTPALTPPIDWQPESMCYARELAFEQVSTCFSSSFDQTHASSPKSTIKFEALTFDQKIEVSKKADLIYRTTKPNFSGLNRTSHSCEYQTYDIDDSILDTLQDSGFIVTKRKDAINITSPNGGLVAALFQRVDPEGRPEVALTFLGLGNTIHQDSPALWNQDFYQQIKAVTANLIDQEDELYEEAKRLTAVMGEALDNRSKSLKFTVIGHSLGASLAQYACNDYVDEVHVFQEYPVMWSKFRALSPENQDKIVSYEVSGDFKTGYLAKDQQKTVSIQSTRLFKSSHIFFGFLIAESIKQSHPERTDIGLGKYHKFL